MSKTQTITKPKNEEEDVTHEDLPTQSDSAEILADTDAILDEIEELIQDAPESQEQKPFTLADAIRAGSAVTGQAIGSWTTPNGETCALSAAAIALAAMGLD